MAGWGDPSFFRGAGFRGKLGWLIKLTIFKVIEIEYETLQSVQCDTILERTKSYSKGKTRLEFHF